MKKANRILTAVLMLVMVITMAQPIEASAANAKPVVKATQKVVSKGKTTKLKATYNGKNVTKKATWKSSNKKVATVNKGKLTARKTGTTYVTATYKKTSKKVKITVAETKLNKTSLELTAGKTYTLKATYNKKRVKPTFKTSNATVATVNKAGVIATKKAGTAYITAVYKGNKATCKVRVAEKTVQPTVCDHTSMTVTETKPTCTEDGVRTFTCSCGVTKTEVIPATGHDYGKGVLTTPPTADADGVTTYTCKKCGHEKTEPYTDKEWDEEITEYVYVCNDCGKFFGPTEYGSDVAASDALDDHQWDDEVGDYTHNGYHSEEITYVIHHSVE